MSGFTLQPGFGPPPLVFDGRYPKAGNCASVACGVPIIVNSPNNIFCKLCAAARRKRSMKKSDDKRKALKKALKSK